MQIAKRKTTRQNLKTRAYHFALNIITLTNKLPKNQSNQVIINQLLRSATSIGANIIEAQAASSKKDFQNFYNHSLKSANETKFWLALLRDSNNNTLKQNINETIGESKELANILAASILTMKGRR